MRLFGLEITRYKKNKKVEPSPAPNIEERSMVAPGTNEQLKLHFGTFPGLVPTFSPLDNVLESEAYVSALKTNATYCSRAQFSAVRIEKSGELVHDAKNIDRLLQTRPNPLQDAASFWERVAFHYFHFNNAFIYKEVDEFGNVIALWAPSPADIKFVKMKETGEIILRFVINGHVVIYPYNLIAHIKNTNIDNSIFGASNSAIRRVLNLIETNSQGIEQAIANSAYLRFVVKYASKMTDEQRLERANEISKNYLDIEGGAGKVGVLVADSAAEYTELKGFNPITANFKQAEQFNESVYKYLGCPESVIAGKATENEMVAYYERTISPCCERVALELTDKIYTLNEYNRGNRIVFSDRKLQYLPMSTRLQIFNAGREMGIFTAGTLGDLIGLPVPHNLRDKVMISQNYSSNKHGGDDNADGGDGGDGGNKSASDDGDK